MNVSKNILIITLFIIIVILLLPASFQKKIPFPELADLLEPKIRLTPLNTNKNPDVFKYDFSKYDFTRDWASRNFLVWEKALQPFKGQANIHYLEVGPFQGLTMVWMLENILTHPSAKATGIDINVRERYLNNLKKTGFADKVKTHEGMSQKELRKLTLDNFDIIYIDGSHRDEDVLEDAVLSWRLLKKGGILIFDDYRMSLSWDKKSGTQWPIKTFLEFYGKHFEIIHEDYQIILKKRT